MAGDSLFSNTNFWLAVSAAAFVWLARKPFKQMVLGALDKRAETIAAELDEARHLREEAATKLAEAERRQREALKEAESIIATARETAQSLYDKAIADLEADVERRREAAMARIAQAEASAVAEVRTRAVQVAGAVSEEILSEMLTGDRAERVMVGAIEDVRGRLQ